MSKGHHHLILKLAYNWLCYVHKNLLLQIMEISSRKMIFLPRKICLNKYVPTADINSFVCCYLTVKYFSRFQTMFTDLNLLNGASAYRINNTFKFQAVFCYDSAKKVDAGYVENDKQNARSVVLTNFLVMLIAY